MAPHGPVAPTKPFLSVLGWTQQVYESSESVLLIGFGVSESCKDGFAGFGHPLIRVGGRDNLTLRPRVHAPENVEVVAGPEGAVNPVWCHRSVNKQSGALDIGNLVGPLV